MSASVVHPAAARLDLWWARIERLVTAERVFAAALAASVVVFFRIGHRQWFIRDDWAFLLTRARIRSEHGNAAWLFTAQDGHPALHHSSHDFA